MQILVQVLSTRGTSLREAIMNDEKIGAFGLQVVEEKRSGRSPGWAKVRSNDDRRGALNLEWDTSAAILSCRIVTRGSRKPSPVVGDFINYILTRFPNRVQSIITAYR